MTATDPTSSARSAAAAKADAEREQAEAAAALAETRAAQAAAAAAAAGPTVDDKMSEVERIQARIDHTQRLLSSDITELVARTNPVEYSRKLARIGKTVAIVATVAFSVLVVARKFRRR